MTEPHRPPATLALRVRSLLFTVLAFGGMLPLGLIYLPYALLSRDGAIAACKAWCRWALWCARTILGLRTEVRGTPPTGDVLIAAKHQSFLDIILIFNAVPRGRFIMKWQLMFFPIIGQYALRLGCVPVKRGRKGAAIEKMKADVASGRDAGGQLIIYPEGTRIAPGAHVPYKVGTGILYAQLEQPCVPVATNAGVYWPRNGFLRYPGRAVVEFLEPIQPGLDQRAVLVVLAERIEPASDRLLEEAGTEGAVTWTS